LLPTEQLQMGRFRRSSPVGRQPSGVPPSHSWPPRRPLRRHGLRAAGSLALRPPFQCDRRLGTPPVIDQAIRVSGGRVLYARHRPKAGNDRRGSAVASRSCGRCRARRPLTDCPSDMFDHAGMQRLLRRLVAIRSRSPHSCLLPAAAPLRRPKGTSSCSITPTRSRGSTPASDGLVPTDARLDCIAPMTSHLARNCPSSAD
jgi:hypothetical protein